MQSWCCNEVRLFAYKYCLIVYPQFFLPEASFYPGLNGINSILDVQSDDLADNLPDEAFFEDENDWIHIPSFNELPRGQTSKFSLAVTKEVSSRNLISTFIFTATLTETHLERITSHEWTQQTDVWPWHSCHVTWAVYCPNGSDSLRNS